MPIYLTIAQIVISGGADSCPGLTGKRRRTGRNLRPGRRCLSDKAGRGKNALSGYHRARSHLRCTFHSHSQSQFSLEGWAAMSRVITLTTDFGTSDGYVASMKGVILGINPQARIVDITHAIEPQSITASFFYPAYLMALFPRRHDTHGSRRSRSGQPPQGGHI